MFKKYIKLKACAIMSDRLWSFKGGGSYKARFLAKNQQTQGKFFSKNPSIKKCQNCTFKINFQCQKSPEFSQNKLRLRPNILAKRLGGRSLS